MTQVQLKVGNIVQIHEGSMFFEEGEILTLQEHLGGNVYYCSNGERNGAVNFLTKKYTIIEAKKADALNKRKLVTDCINAIQKMNKENEAFIDLLGFEGKYQQQLFELTDQYMNTVMEVVGDTDQMISWFVYDNEFGQKGFEVSINDEFRVIETVEDLFWVMNL